MHEIVNTLIIQNIKTRFYGDKLAYVWNLINPLAWIGALIIFFSLLGKQVPIYTDMISFLLPGMLAYILFRNTINSIMRINKTSQTIMHCFCVTRSIVTVSAALVELLNSIIVFILITSINYIFFAKFECNDILIVIFGYFCAWGTGLIMGSLFAALNNLYPMFEKILPIILRPTFWISGVFYTANELPHWLSEIGSMNPLFQSIEIIRDGTFLSYHSRMALYFQPILFMFGVISIILIMELYIARFYKRY